MGTTLHLIVDPEDRDSAVIEEYYDYVVEKYERLDTDDTMKVEWINDRRTRHVNLFENEDNFTIFEYVPRGSGVNDAANKLFKMMHLMYEQADPDTAHGEETIAELVDVLQDIKEELKETSEESGTSEYTPDDREAQFETEPIAICEFALENGYGIEVSY